MGKRKEIKLTVKYVRFEDLEPHEQERMMYHKKLLGRQVVRLIDEIIQRNRAEKAKQKRSNGKDSK